MSLINDEICIKHNSIMRNRSFMVMAITAMLLMVQVPNLLFAQKSINDFKKELEQNIYDLDLIEGLYNVTVKVEAYAPRIGWDSRTQNFTAVVRAHPDEKGKFFLIALKGDAEGLIGIIQKAGGNGYYSMKRGDANGNMHTVQIQLKDMFYFGIVEQESLGNARSKTEMNFVKTYPTATMYSEAIRKYEEEHNKPEQWTGSGFAIQEGYVVTNYHVIDGAGKISIQGTKDIFSESVEAQVVAIDKDNDIAILKIKGNVPEIAIPYSIKTFTSDVGEEVWVWGYPLTSTMGDEIKLTTGVISSRSGYEGSVTMYQISAPAQPGNSGGPVFDKDGNLIGIVCSKHVEAENVTYAIKASCLRNLIESSINHDILPHTNSLMGKELTQKVKEVKRFVYYINCTR